MNISLLIERKSIVKRFKGWQLSLILIVTYLVMQVGSLFLAKTIITFLTEKRMFANEEAFAHALGWSNTSLGIIAALIFIGILSSNPQYLSIVFNNQRAKKRKPLFAKNEFFALFKGRKETLNKTILWGFAGFFLAMLGQMVAGIIEKTLFDTEPGSANTEVLSNVAQISPVIIVTIVLLAPFLEEVIFRRVIFGSIYQKTNFWIAAILSGVIFAAVHNELEHLLIYMAPGIVFAFIYYKTQRLLAPIIAHTLMNGFVMIVQLNADKILDLQNTVPSFIQFWTR